MRIPVKGSCGKYGVEFKNPHITKNCNVFGRIFFANTETAVYDEETENTKK